MPLLHEIKDLDDETILCFLPSGHLTDEGFKDFPVQIGNTCGYYAIQRLTTLKHTQKPFKETEYGPIGIILLLVKDKLGSIEKIKDMCLRISYSFIKGNLIVNSNTLQLYLQNLPKIVKDELEEINASEKKKPSSMKIKNNNEIFIEMFLCMGETFTANYHKINVNNFQEFSSTFSIIFSEYMQKIGDDIRREYFKYLPLKDLLAKEGLDFDVSNQQDLEPCNLQQIIFGLNSAIIPITEDQELNYRSWKTFFIKILSELGPFVVGGYVGIHCYSGAESKDCGSLGSVTLLAFNDIAYKNISCQQPHAVIVIGIYRNKIIYLDPNDGSKLLGPRQAYIMDIYKFMERIKTSNQLMYDGVLRLITIKKGEIDTTLELMQSQIGKKSTYAIVNKQLELKKNNDAESIYITWVANMIKENKKGCLPPLNSYINENGVTSVMPILAKNVYIYK